MLPSHGTGTDSNRRWCVYITRDCFTQNTQCQNSKALHSAPGQGAISLPPGPQPQGEAGLHKPFLHNVHCPGRSESARILRGMNHTQVYLQRKDGARNPALGSDLWGTHHCRLGTAPGPGDCVQTPKGWGKAPRSPWLSSSHPIVLRAQFQLPVRVLLAHTTPRNKQWGTAGPGDWFRDQSGALRMNPRSRGTFI